MIHGHLKLRPGDVPEGDDLSHERYFPQSVLDVRTTDLGDFFTPFLGLDAPHEQGVESSCWYIHSFTSP